MTLLLDHWHLIAAALAVEWTATATVMFAKSAGRKANGPRTPSSPGGGGTASGRTTTKEAAATSPKRRAAASN
jgi:hypothetical protein